jgi:hypothetical protein
MCPIHHDVIDADEGDWPAERLKQLKSRHESSHSGETRDLTDKQAQAFIDRSSVTVSGGSVVITYNQVGGQAANVINNYGPSKRLVTPAIQERMIRVLNDAKPGRIAFASTQGDVEAHEYKHQLMNVFRSAGWHVEDMATFMFFGAKKGLVITIPQDASEQGLPQIVANALSQTGSPLTGNRGDMARDCGIYVQVWHAP